MKKLEIFIAYTEEYDDVDGVYYAQAVVNPETLILEESDAIRLQEALYKVPLDEIGSINYQPLKWLVCLTLNRLGKP